MSVDATVRTGFPEGYTVPSGADGKVITTRRSEEHPPRHHRADADRLRSRPRPAHEGHLAAHTHEHGTGKLPVPPADGRTPTLGPDEVPRP